MPEEALLDLLKAAGCSDGVIAHSLAVRDAAMALASRPWVNRDLIAAGALLHDIGRAQTHGIGHAQAGADYCRSLGLQEEICRIVERHIGAGLTADECTLLGLLPRDCCPESPEEKIVANADNLVSGERTITIQERLLRSMHLPRRKRRQIYRLYLEMELLR
ncbi:trna cytosine methylase pos56 [hydrocarbon metagenome]|uniref:Trna cytosine methylase pos56 n=1 Tax=hydrocarbon metagenome TaxID=938273 RepID=A0A0W8FG55_9ZZZZ|nr:HDIG domain-containing protein [Methanomicrobiaceae archaeon]